MILSKKGLCIYNSLLLLLILNSPEHTSGTVTQAPTTACVGESITVSCTLEVPDANDNFFSVLTNFIVGDSDAPITETAVNGIGTHGGVDLSKLMATAIVVNSKSVEGSITLLSYTPGDNGIRLGCTNEYFINGNNSNRDMVTETLNIRQADVPDNPTNIEVDTSSLSPTDCSNAIISWSPPASSDRAVEGFHVYRNGTFLATVPASTYQYMDPKQLNISIPYSYSVVANSCAGNSTAGYKIHTLKGYSFDDSFFIISYDSSTEMLSISWALNTTATSPELNIGYSIQLTQEHKQSNRTITFSPFRDTFSQLSTDTNNIQEYKLKMDQFTENVTVQVKITAVLNITHLCGKNFSGNSVTNTTTTEYTPSAPTSPPDTSSAVETTPTSTTDNTSTTVNEPIDQEIIIGVGVAGGSLLIIFGVTGGIIAIIVVLYKKNEKKRNLNNEEGEQLEAKQLNQKSAELVYAELDLVASKIGGITQTVEDTHYMPVRQTMEKPYK